MQNDKTASQKSPIFLLYVTSSIDEEKYSYQLDLNTSLRPNNKKMSGH